MHRKVSFLLASVAIPLSLQQTESMQPLRPYEKLDTLQQFLDYDRHVLRFYCRWDDSPSIFGDIRWLELHYFLADDTLEVLEKIPANAGRDAVPVFLRRARLPKVSCVCSLEYFPPPPFFSVGCTTSRPAWSGH